MRSGRTRAAWGRGVACMGIAVMLIAQGCGGGSTAPSGSDAGATTSATQNGSGGNAANDDGGGASSAAPLIINDPVGPATLDATANACGFEDDWVNNFYRQLVRVGRKAGFRCFSRAGNFLHHAG